MDHVGPLTFNGVRFALGALTLLPFALRGDRATEKERLQRLTNKQAVLGGGLAGLVLFGGATLQQVGLVFTTAGKAGFITGLYVVIVPLLGMLWRQWPRLGRLGRSDHSCSWTLLSQRYHGVQPCSRRCLGTCERFLVGNSRSLIGIPFTQGRRIKACLCPICGLLLFKPGGGRVHGDYYRPWFARGNNPYSLRGCDVCRGSLHPTGGGPEGCTPDSCSDHTES